jgi:hypothetical protein
MPGTRQFDDNSILLRRNANGPLGTFTITGSSTAVVANTSITANSIIEFFPLNAAAAQAEGSALKLYQFSLTAGTGFTAGTGSGGAVTGPANYGYRIYN